MVKMLVCELISIVDWKVQLVRKNVLSLFCNLASKAREAALGSVEVRGLGFTGRLSSSL